MRLSRVISLNEKGEDVLYIQERLYHHGYYHDIMNSIFDTKTLKAFNRFQEDMNIEITDVVNIKTFNLLKGDIKENKNIQEKVIQTIYNFKIKNLAIDSKYYHNIKETKTKVVFNFINNQCINTYNMVYYNQKNISQVIIGDEILYRYDIEYSPNAKKADTIFIDICGIYELSRDLENNIKDYNYNTYNDEILKFKNKLYNKLPDIVYNNIFLYLKYLNTKLKLDYSDIDFGILKNDKKIHEYIKLLW